MVKTVRGLKGERVSYDVAIRRAATVKLGSGYDIFDISTTIATIFDKDKRKVIDDIVRERRNLIILKKVS